MKIIDFIKEKFFKKNPKTLLLDQPPHLYDNLIKKNSIESIIKNMPQNLTQIEQAYYIYLELGKLLSENPKFVFADYNKKKKLYNSKIDNNYNGICKSISQLYVSVLQDKRININAECVKQSPDSPISHIDTMLKIDGKNYISNLISDLSRIKTSRRVNNFAYNPSDDSIRPCDTDYINNLNSHYGKIDFLTREKIEKMDKKLNYSFFIPKYMSDDQRGIYTEDTLQLLKKDFNDPELFKKYVLHDRNFPEEYFLKYKLDFIFENIHNFTNYNITDENNPNIKYLESIRYYMKISKELLTPEECARIKAYVITYKQNFKKIISILKVKLPSTSSASNTAYYMFSDFQNKYVDISSEDLKFIFEDKYLYNLNIIGTFDQYDTHDIDDLEL